MSWDHMKILYLLGGAVAGPSREDLSDEGLEEEDLDQEDDEEEQPKKKSK